MEKSTRKALESKGEAMTERKRISIQGLVDVYDYMGEGVIVKMKWTKHLNIFEMIGDVMRAFGIEGSDDLENPEVKLVNVYKVPRGSLYVHFLVRSAVLVEKEEDDP